LFSVPLLLSISAGQAADINWLGGTADYTNMASWAGGVVPASGDNAINDSGSNNVVRINAADPNWTVTDIRAGNGAGDGSFVQNSKVVTINGWWRLGIASNNTGIYTLNGGTLNYNVGHLSIGELGTGILNVNGGNITGSGNFAVNLVAAFDGSGTVNPNTCIFTQSSGAITISGQFFVGNRGPGIYYLSGGSMDVTNYIAIGRSSGNGMVFMTGGRLNQNGGGGNFIIGSGYQNNGSPSTGVLYQSGGTINSLSQFLCPESSPSAGTYNMSGTAVLNASDWIAVGRQGAPGFLNLTNGAITKTGNGNITIGAGGIGILTQVGGTITNTATETWVGETTNGTWNLIGGTAVVGVVRIGANGGATGTLNLSGGTLTANEITGHGGATNTLTLNGGTLRAGANGANLIHGLAQTTIGASGIILDSAGFNVTISQNLLDNGGGPMTKNGTGIVTLTGVNSYHGSRTINAGKLVTGTFSASGGNFTVANGAGMGVVVESANGQLSAPTVVLGSSTTTAMDFDLGSFSNPTLAPLNVTSTLAVNSTVTVNVLSNSVMQLGQFPLIKYASRTGVGGFVMGALPWGAQAHIVTNTANSSIDLVVTVPTSSESVASSFDGQGATGWTPPDSNAAVGPNHIVSWGNNSLMILSKTGTVISSQDATAFFGFGTYGDGHVIYNEISQRFALETYTTTGAVAFAVSDTSDPTGPWHKTSITVPGLWDGYGGNGIGYNADAYVVHVNGFNNNYAVIAASNNVNLAYTLVAAPSNVRIGRPASMPGTASGGPYYFVEGNDDGINGTGGVLGSIEVVKISNILSSGRTYSDYQVPVTSGEASAINVSWRNNLLAVVGSINNPATVNWYLLSTIHSVINKCAY
jgi:autotransporter-associated beta strand protein